jgi:hypothetical protein
MVGVEDLAHRDSGSERAEVLRAGRVGIVAQEKAGSADNCHDGDRISAADIAGAVDGKR